MISSVTPLYVGNSKFPTINECSNYAQYLVMSILQVIMYTNKMLYLFNEFFEQHMSS